MENAAIDEARILELAFRYSSDFETYRDNAGKIRYCSQSIERMIGYTVEEYLSGKITPIDFIHPDDYDKTMQELQKLYKGESGESFIIRYIHKNGKMIWVELTGSRVMVSDEMIGIRISARDITEKLELEQELRKMNAAKDKFYSIISHDLRSPFNGLIALTQMMIDDLGNMSKEEIGENLTMLHDSSQNTLELLEQLLTWTRSQSGRLDAKPVDVDLELVAKGVISLLDNSAQKKSVRLIADLNKSIVLHADKDMLRTILENLVANAIKFTRESGSVTIQASRKDTFAEITVSDTGVGMSDKVKSSLFNIEGARSTPGTNHEKGTGLGLLLCKEFVEKHGGQIWAESKSGKGSTFKFTLPLAQ